MNKWIIILVIVIILTALYMSRNKIAKTAAGVYSTIRGVRNNNPGNIRLTFDSKGNPTYWTGEIKGTDKDFKTFKSMPYGFRAMFITLNSYFNKGFDTVSKIVSRYAPAADNNDTAAYIRNVAMRLNVNENLPLKFSDVETVKKLIAAMSRQELGIEPDKSMIDEGYKLFKG